MEAYGMDRARDRAKIDDLSVFEDHLEETFEGLEKRSDELRREKAETKRNAAEATGQQQLTRTTQDQHKNDPTAVERELRNEREMSKALEGKNSQLNSHRDQRQVTAMRYYERMKSAAEKFKAREKDCDQT
jgi:hypothetical protein